MGLLGTQKQDSTGPLHLTALWSGSNGGATHRQASGARQRASRKRDCCPDSSQAGCSVRPNPPGVCWRTAAGARRRRGAGRRGGGGAAKAGEGRRGAAASSRLCRSRASTYPRGRARLAAPQRGAEGRSEVRHEALQGGWRRGASPSSGREGGGDGEGRRGRGRAAGPGGPGGNAVGGLAEPGHAAPGGGRRGLGLTGRPRPAACLARPAPCAPWAALHCQSLGIPICAVARLITLGTAALCRALDRRYISSFQVGFTH